MKKILLFLSISIITLFITGCSYRIVKSNDYEFQFQKKKECFEVCSKFYNDEEKRITESLERLDEPEYSFNEGLNTCLYSNVNMGMYPNEYNKYSVKDCFTGEMLVYYYMSSQADRGQDIMSDGITSIGDYFVKRDELMGFSRIEQER